MFFVSLLSIILLLLSPVIVISNLLILSAWLRYKRLRTPSNALLISLSSADLGFGLLLPAAVAVDLTLPERTLEDGEGTPCENTICLGHFVILLILCSAALLSIAAIALDRFMSVAQPLRYNHFVTMSHVQRFVVGFWIYSSLLGGIPLLFFTDWSVERLISWLSLLVYIPCAFSAILSYGYIYVIARSHARAIYSVEISLNNGGILETISPSHHRYGLTLALIIGDLILCWTPIQMCALLDNFIGSKILYHQEWRVVVATPIVLSSVINPWLYAYHSSEVRHAVVRIVDSAVTKITGRPPMYPMFLQNKGEMTSCASNVRLLSVSPSPTTVPSVNGNGNGSSTVIESNQKHLHFLLCDHQVSSL